MKPLPPIMISTAAPPPKGHSLSPAASAVVVALDKARTIAEDARRDRPTIPPGEKRRRCGDVLRWKENNRTIDQIVGDIGALISSEAEKDGFKLVQKRKKT